MTHRCGEGHRRGKNGALGEPLPARLCRGAPTSTLVHPMPGMVLAHHSLLVFFFFFF